MSAITYMWWISILIDISLMSAWGQNNDCQLKLAGSDYEVVYYTHYCNHGNAMKRMKSSGLDLECQSRQRLKLLNFKAIITGAKDPCSLSQFDRGTKLNTSCLLPQKRDEIVRPFMQALSGKLPQTAKEYEPGFQDELYQQIELVYDCEKKIDKRVDMCEPSSETFHGKANVSFYFKEETYRRNINHTSCYCHFTTVNSTLKVIARAFDVRLHPSSQLSINNEILDSNKIYWWQSGVLNPDASLHRISLSGLNLNTLPTSVWMDIYGSNMKIECHQLKEGEKEIVTEIEDKTSLARSGSSSSGFGIGYILLTVLAIIVVIIIIAIVIKCVIFRRSKSLKRNSHSMEDSEASEMLTIPSKKDYPIEAPHPKTGEIYSKPNQTVVYAVGDDSEAQVLLSQSEQGENKRNNDANSSFSDTAADSKDTTKEEEQHIYNHFNDPPDVIPDSTNNIYNTTAAEVYSTFNTKRQDSVQDPTYDVA